MQKKVKKERKKERKKKKKERKKESKTKKDLKDWENRVTRKAINKHRVTKIQVHIVYK